MTWYINEKLTENKTRQWSFRTQRDLMEFVERHQIEVQRMNRIEYAIVAGEVA